MLDKNDFDSADQAILRTTAHRTQWAAKERAAQSEYGPNPEQPESLAQGFLWELVSIVDEATNKANGRAAMREDFEDIVRRVLHTIDGSGEDTPALELSVSNSDTQHQLANFFKQRGEDWPVPGTPLNDLKKEWTDRFDAQLMKARSDPETTNQST